MTFANASACRVKKYGHHPFSVPIRSKSSKLWTPMRADAASAPCLEDVHPILGRAYEFRAGNKHYLLLKSFIEPTGGDSWVLFSFGNHPLSRQLATLGVYRLCFVYSWIDAPVSHNQLHVGSHVAPEGHFNNTDKFFRELKHTPRMLPAPGGVPDLARESIRN